PQPADLLVDAIAAPAGVDHRAANGLQCDRPEVRGERQPVEPAEVADHLLVFLHLAGRAAVGAAVMSLGVGPERLDEVAQCDATAGVGNRDGSRGTGPDLRTDS